MSTSVSSTNISCRVKPTSQQYSSKIQPPSTLPLRTTSKLKQPQITRNAPIQSYPVSQSAQVVTSRIPPPRVSFLTPREVWSPLSTPIPGMNENKLDVRMAIAPSKVPKYQLKDTGPVPLPTTQRSIPRPQIRSKHPVARSSIKAHRQPSFQRPSTQIPRPQVRPLSTQYTATQQSSRLPVPTPRSRPVSLPANQPLPVAVPKTRPISYQPVSNRPSYAPHTVSSIHDSHIIADQPSSSFQPTPDIPTSIAPTRELSNQSAASSACSSASSLARHRAIKGRGLDRNSFARLSSYSPPSHGAIVQALCAESESEDTESTLSDHSIQTIATVNPIIVDNEESYRRSSLDESIHDSEVSYSVEAKSKHPSLFLFSENPQQELTAPYLVSSNAPPMTLEWESDESSGEIDQAQKTWRELENRLGRRVQGRSLRRGRWVVKPREEVATNTEVTSHVLEDTRASYGIKRGGSGSADEGSAEMEATSSGFSISMYYSPSSPKTTPPLDIHKIRQTTYTYGSSPLVESPSSATALFDMSAPLVPSGSKNGYTPCNTPLMNKESIKRGARVKKPLASVDVSDITQKDRLSSLEEDARVDFVDIDSSEDGKTNSQPMPYSSTQYYQAQDSSSEESPIFKPEKLAQNMYRLDSHIVSALSALQGDYNSPDLDFALSASSSMSPTSSFEHESDATHEDRIGGLGLGMKLNLKTVYHLPTLSPRLRPSAAQKSLMVKKDEQQFDDEDVQEELQHDLRKMLEELPIGPKRMENPIPEDGTEEVDEALVIRDLDTGLERQIKAGEDW
ncbi:uncharacterized protein L201_003859 [Kwoniella dendrophila CBS 6074]|uniref:Uncharacterized protein n=1 Tax=Kwoniella dendrophila CBS 6074 TaxID=1295534 RepID=A0AAX4JVU5_9TREE